MSTPTRNAGRSCGAAVRSCCAVTAPPSAAMARPTSATRPFIWLLPVWHNALAALRRLPARRCSTDRDTRPGRRDLELVEAEERVRSAVDDLVLRRQLATEA